MDNSIKQHIEEDKYYPIGEAAKLVGKDRHTLLRYTRENPKAFPHKISVQGGRKLFSGKVLKSLLLGTI